MFIPPRLIDLTRAGQKSGVFDNLLAEGQSPVMSNFEEIAIDNGIRSCGAGGDA
jgi:hypothetical protein